MLHYLAAPGGPSHGIIAAGAGCTRFIGDRETPAKFAAEAGRDAAAMAERLRGDETRDETLAEAERAPSGAG